MMIRMLLIAIYLIMFFIMSGTLFAQKMTDSELEKQIEINYKKLSQKDFEDRKKAVFFFHKLETEKLNERILDAMAEILREEKNKGVLKVKKGARDTGEAIGEEYGLYIESLCEIIGNSRDVQKLPLLIENCLEPKVLINFGDAAVTPLVDIISDPMTRRDKKRSAIFVIGEMLKPKRAGYVASGEVRSKIKKALLQTTSDEDKNIRQVSVRALGDSEDNDLIPILEKIAQSDSEHFAKKDRNTGEMKTRYPVREEAEKALKKIKEKNVENK